MPLSSDKMSPLHLSLSSDAKGSITNHPKLACPLKPRINPISRPLILPDQSPKPGSATPNMLDRAPLSPENLLKATVEALKAQLDEQMKEFRDRQAFHQAAGAPRNLEATGKLEMSDPRSTRINSVEASAVTSLIPGNVPKDAMKEGEHDRWKSLLPPPDDPATTGKMDLRPELEAGSEPTPAVGTCLGDPRADFVATTTQDEILKESGGGGEEGSTPGGLEPFAGTQEIQLSESGDGFLKPAEMLQQAVSLELTHRSKMEMLKRRIKELKPDFDVDQKFEREVNIAILKNGVLEDSILMSFEEVLPSATEPVPVTICEGKSLLAEGPVMRPTRMSPLAAPKQLKDVAVACSTEHTSLLPRTGSTEARNPLTGSRLEHLPPDDILRSEEYLLKHIRFLTLLEQDSSTECEELRADNLRLNQILMDMKCCMCHGPLNFGHRLNSHLPEAAIDMTSSSGSLNVEDSGFFEASDVENARLEPDIPPTPENPGLNLESGFVQSEEPVPPPFVPIPEQTEILPEGVSVLSLWQRLQALEETVRRHEESLTAVPVTPPVLVVSAVGTQPDLKPKLYLEPLVDHEPETVLEPIPEMPALEREPEVALVQALPRAQLSTPTESPELAPDNVAMDSEFVLEPAGIMEIETEWPQDSDFVPEPSHAMTADILDEPGIMEVDPNWEFDLHLDFGLEESTNVKHEAFLITDELAKSCTIFNIPFTL